MALYVPGYSCTTKQCCFQWNGWGMGAQQWPVPRQKPPGMPPSCAQTGQCRPGHGMGLPGVVREDRCSRCSHDEFLTWTGAHQSGRAGNSKTPESIGSSLPQAWSLAFQALYPLLCLTLSQLGPTVGTRFSIPSSALVNNYKGNLPG